MAYYNAQKIEEIDLSSQSAKRPTHSLNNKVDFFLSNNDNIDQTDQKSKPIPPPKPVPPERSKTKSPAPSNESSINSFKPRPNKRIAPRILPKIPDNNTSIQFKETSPLLSKSMSNNNRTDSQNSSISEQNFFIQIDQVGWFYKKEQLQDGLKTQSSVPYQMEDQFNNSSLNTDIHSNNGSNPNLPTAAPTAVPTDNNPINNKKWNLFGKVDSQNLELGYRVMMNERNGGDKLVQVLDDLYEVNLSSKKCYAIYWKARRTFSVMRTVWFQENGEPFEEKVSDEIESKHVELYRDVIGRAVDTDGSVNSDLDGGRMEASSPTEEMKKIEKAVEPIGSLNLEEGIVTWYAKEEVYWEKNKMTLIEKVNFGFSKFRNKFNGMRIKRGLKQQKSSKENEVDEKYEEITHLVFVVHGIAQKMYENGIVKNCEDLRKECEKKKKEYYPTHKSQRYMFLPVDWRSSLTLDDGIVETITPNSIQLIREKLNSSALDIMYYTSPLFRIEILNSLSSELNRLYELFCQKNPYFKDKFSKVSFVAHSLGTVIVYDILTSDNSIAQFSNTYGQVSNHQLENFKRYSHNDSTLLNEYLHAKQRIQEIENQLVKSNNNIMPLGFQAVNFFSLGSPLAVFLAMRGVRPAGTGTQEHILPKNLCQNLYNIFHPSDPIAYRIEPLIIKHYTNKSPLEIQKSDLAPKVTYKELNEKRAGFSLGSDLGGLKMGGNKGGNKRMKDRELEESVGYNSNSGLGSVGSSPVGIEPVELENALDFQLQDSNFELMATLRAHTCYWKSSDTALFILNQLITNDEV